MTTTDDRPVTVTTMAETDRVMVVRATTPACIIVVLPPDLERAAVEAQAADLCAPRELAAVLGALEEGDDA